MRRLDAYRRSGSGPRANSSRGFTLFEMVVSIIVIMILYTVAEQRLNQIPAAAERAAFQGMLSQIKNAVQLEMVSTLTGGGKNAAIRLAGTNPIDFFVERPSNYRGELEQVTDRNVERANWYFETSSSQLVYVVGGRSIEDVEVAVGNVPVNYGQIRFELVNVYDEDDNWQALVLEEVWPYEWTRRRATPVDLNG